MRKIYMILAGIVLAAGVFASCQKPFVTSIDLAIDYSDEFGGMVLEKFKADSCYIHVTSNTDWNAKLIFDGEPWARLGFSSGNGQAWIPLYYEDNYSGEERMMTFHINGAGKEIEITITQPTGSI